MIWVLTLGLPRGVRHKTAQPVGSRQRQAPAQCVDPDHRAVDSCLPKTAQPRTHLRLVQSLNDHFPLSRVRRGASSKPLPRVLLPPPSFPLSWHLPSITGQRQGGKAMGPSTHTHLRSVIICQTVPSLGAMPVPNGRLRATRLALLLSYRDLAWAIMVNPALLARWESGADIPVGRGAARLLEELTGFTVEDLGLTRACPAGSPVSRRRVGNRAAGSLLAHEAVRVTPARLAPTEVWLVRHEQFPDVWGTPVTRTHHAVLLRYGDRITVRGIRGSSVLSLAMDLVPDGPVAGGTWSEWTTDESPSRTAVPGRCGPAPARTERFSAQLPTPGRRRWPGHLGTGAAGNRRRPRCSGCLRAPAPATGVNGPRRHQRPLA